MNRIRTLLFLTVALTMSGCTTVNVAQMQVMGQRQEIGKLDIHVDKTAFNEGGEAVALV